MAGCWSVPTLVACYIVLCGFFAAPLVAGAELRPIPIITYHDKPPYMVDIKAQQGLYFDFVRLLNEKSDTYQFSLTFIPRNRVRKMVANENFSGIILGVSPLWFNDVAQTKYLWSKALYQDEDIFVSLKEKPFEFSGASSLTGKHICLVLGNYYAGISDKETSLALNILNTSREAAIFDLLDSKRCDFGIVSRSDYNYKLQHGEIFDRYHVSKAVHDTFDRRILLAKTQLPVHLFIEQVLKDWQVNAVH